MGQGIYRNNVTLSKGAGKSVIKQFDPVNWVIGTYQFLYDPASAILAMLRTPGAMLNGMLNALRNCDYEAMGELSADIGLMLYGGAELGIGLVDVVGVKPRGTPNAALATGIA